MYRGDEMETIVKDFKIEETRIRISDLYCREITENEIKERLENITKQTIGYFQLKK